MRPNNAEEVECFRSGRPHGLSIPYIRLRWQFFIHLQGTPGYTIELRFTFLSSGFEVLSFSFGSHPLCVYSAAYGFRPLSSSSKISPFWPQSFIPQAIERTKKLPLRRDVGYPWDPVLTQKWHSVRAQVPWTVQCLAHRIPTDSQCFIRIGFVPFYPQRLCPYCSLLKVPVQCTIIHPACIHEWLVLNRNIQVEINNQSLRAGKKNPLMHSVVFKRSYH